jgi:hypothetical protein
MSGPRLVAAIVAGLVVIALVVGIGIFVNRGQDASGPGTPLADGTPWPRAAFIRSCTDACRKAPGMTDDKYPICDTACACAADEAVKIMSYQELVSAEQALGSGAASPEQTAKIKQIQAAGARCTGAAPPPQK